MIDSPSAQLGLMWVLAAGGFLYWQRWFGRYPVRTAAFVTLILLGTALALVCGHLAYLVASGTRPSMILALLYLVEDWRAGYQSVGVILGFGLALLIVAVLFRYRVLYLADIFAPGLFGFSVIWRLGCFFDGCCYGTATTLPWGVSSAHFPGQLVHPTQLYEAGASGLLFLLTPLVLRWQKARPGNGLIVTLCLLGYALVRLVIDHFRVGASLDPVLAGLSATQLAAASVALLCGLTILYKARQPTVTASSPIPQ